MVNKPKAIGTAAESAVVRFLRENGFPFAERTALAGALDRGDITGTPGLAFEVKAGRAAETASDGLVTSWLAETERERITARAGVGVLVLKRNAIGPKRAGEWWAIVPATVFIDRDDGPPLADDIPVRLRLADMVRVLRSHGYGSAP